MFKKELREVRQQIAEKRQELALLEAREWALSVAGGRSKEQVLELSVGRRQAVDECARRAEAFSQNLRGGDKSLVRGTWNHNAQVNRNYADALDEIVKNYF